MKRLAKWIDSLYWLSTIVVFYLVVRRKLSVVTFQIAFSGLGTLCNNSELHLVYGIPLSIICLFQVQFMKDKVFELLFAVYFTAAQLMCRMSFTQKLYLLFIPIGFQDISEYVFVSFILQKAFKTKQKANILKRFQFLELIVEILSVILLVIKNWFMTESSLNFVFFCEFAIFQIVTNQNSKYVNSSPVTSLLCNAIGVIFYFYREIVFQGVDIGFITPIFYTIQFLVNWAIFEFFRNKDNLYVFGHVAAILVIPVYQHYRLKIVEQMEALKYTIQL